MGSRWQVAAAVPLLLGALLTAPGAQAQGRGLIKIPPPAGRVPPATAQDASNDPDFSEVTSKTAANKLVRQGRLVKIRAFPTELGGPNDPMNIAYITPRAEEDRQRLIAKLRRLLEQDAIDQLDVQADYKGKSIIPSRLRYTATHSRGGAPIEAVVEVW